LIFAISLQSSLSEDLKAITCVYRQTTFGYTCDISKLVVLSAGEIEINGKHLENQTNADVDVIWVSKSLTPFVITQLFDAFPKATTFRVEASNLEELQENAFENAATIQQMNFNSNPLETIPARAFFGAVELKRLVLERNSLESIDENAFEGLESLELLRIGENHLKELPSNVFANLPNLTLLFINDNLLETIDSSLFANNPKLSHVQVQGNAISAVAPTVFINQLAIEEINLTNNLCVNEKFVISEFTSIESFIEGISVCIENFEVETETVEVESK
jgi:Leucine-rich repeat (LRR) protein